MFGLSQALNQVYYTVDQYVKNLQEPEEFKFFDESDSLNDPFDSIGNTDSEIDSEAYDSEDNDEEYFELEHSIHDFELIKELGEGQYGKVYLGRFNKVIGKPRRTSLSKRDSGGFYVDFSGSKHSDCSDDEESEIDGSENSDSENIDSEDFSEKINSNHLIAIKSLSKLQTLSDLDQLYTEKRCLEFKSENLVRSICSFHDLNRVYFCLEYCQGGDLFEFIIQSENQLNLTDTKSVAYQIGKGIKYLHEKNFIHRDIKPENVLITSDGQMKIGDFGMAKELMMDFDYLTKTKCGSPYATAPEVLKKSFYSFGVDVWSFGVLIYELLEWHQPFPSNGNEFEDVTENLPEKMENCDSLENGRDAVDLVFEMLAVNPEKRPCINSVLDHAFFQDLEPIDIESCLKDNSDFRRIMGEKTDFPDKTITLNSENDRFEKNVDDEDLFFNTFCYTNVSLIESYTI
jgi:serine/threonine protein kinase